MRRTLLAAIVAIAATSTSYATAPAFQAAGTDAASPGGNPATVGGVNVIDLSSLGLSDEQRDRVTEVQRSLQRKRWEAIGALREQRWKIEDAMRSLEMDDEAMRKAFEGMAKVRKDMFESELDARRKLKAILTKDQRERLAQRRKAAGQKPAS